jgi:hypothetical protein
MKDLIMAAESLTPMLALEAVRNLLMALENKQPIYQEDLLDFYAALVFVDMQLSELSPEPPGIEDI